MLNKCPKCGMRLSEGTLYCEHCGEDIHIVPDFEPEVEITIEESLLQIREDAFEEGEQTAEGEKGKKRFFSLNVCISILLIFSILVILLAILFMNHSETFQLQRAQHFMDAGNPVRALQNYERAARLNPERASTKLLLSQCYHAAGEETAFITVLKELVGSGQAEENELITAYSRLILYYKEQNEYEKIDKLLAACDNEYIIKTYGEYLVYEPEFNYSGGYYREIVPLKIASRSKGIIYYTLDGTVPDKDSMVYDGSTIFLSGGQTHTVKAILVSEYGVVSECVTAQYEVELLKPAPPVVHPISGEYAACEPIIIEAEENEEVYYTTDGTVPTAFSKRYRGELVMENGYTLYRFITVDENGLASDYVEREYIVVAAQPSHDTEQR